MTPPEFIAKWQKANLPERSAAQQHFLDLCDLLGQPKPAAADPEGTWYTFERGTHKTGGGDGWADVWLRGHFDWEYKRKHKDLENAPSASPYVRWPVNAHPCAYSSVPDEDIPQGVGRRPGSGHPSEELLALGLGEARVA
jgi:hypothetical protein